MNTILSIAAIAIGLTVPVGMIVGNTLRKNREATTRPATPADADIEAINKGICPDCGTAGSLCGGPSGGMSQNIACDSCHMEFNVAFGFGTGAFHVERTGKLSAYRARSAFGIDMGLPS